MMMYANGIAEAKQCLADIEGAVLTAREYLIYLEEVAQVISDYGNERGTATKAAKEYLANIDAATSSAEAYLEYLEGVAKMVREQLLRMERFTPQQQDEEKKARTLLEDLEETVKQAQEYLSYLNGVANIVQQFVNKPTSPPPPFLANILGGGRPSFPRPPPVPTAPSSFSKPAPVGGGMKSYIDSVNGGTLPSFGGGVSQPPPVPAEPQASSSVPTVSEVLDRRKEFAQKKERVPVGSASYESYQESVSSKTSVTEDQGTGDLESLSVKKAYDEMTDSTGIDMSIVSLLFGLAILAILTVLSIYPDVVLTPLADFFRAPVETLESLPQIELESLPDIKSESLPGIMEQVTQPLAPPVSVPPPDSVPPPVSVPAEVIEEVPDFDDWSF